MPDKVAVFIVMGTAIVWLVVIWDFMRASVRTATTLADMHRIMHDVVYGGYSINVSVWLEDDDDLMKDDWPEGVDDAERAKDFGNVHPGRGYGDTVGGAGDSEESGEKGPPHWNGP